MILSASRLNVLLEFVMNDRITSGATPAWASRTTCASGLVGKMAGGVVTGGVFSAGLSSATGEGLALGGGGAVLVICALAAGGRQTIVAANTPIPAPVKMDLEIEFFIK